MNRSVHIPVLHREVLEGLALRKDSRVIDATLGGGGHADLILARTAPSGRLLGIDQDPDALVRTRARLAGYGERFVSAAGNFEHLRELAEAHGFHAADGVLMDLGVSSDHLDRPERGFSFQNDGPLDMRMDPSTHPSAAEWLAEVEERTLAEVLFRLGEERQSRRVARAIVEARARAPLRSTLQLAEVVERALGGRRGRIHPATRTFQAIRMHINRELAVLERGLDGAMEVLAPGGRLAVISFHSLEDRLVKQRMRLHIGRDESLPQGGSVWRGKQPKMCAVTRKALVAGDEERALNPRARSAKLRIVEKSS